MLKVIDREAITVDGRPLARITFVEVEREGYPNFPRVHSIDFKPTMVKYFPLDSTVTGFINIGLFSIPQTEEQVNQKPVMLENRPTYFKSNISDSPHKDIDLRLSNDILKYVAPELFL